MNAECDNVLRIYVRATSPEFMAFDLSYGARNALVSPYSPCQLQKKDSTVQFPQLYDNRVTDLRERSVEK